jgi:RNA polymerase sigma factor (sigma-70 family)
VVQIDPPEELERHCRAVVGRLIARYQWRLLDPEELAQRAFQRIRAGAANSPIGAAIGAYCVALHAACSGAEGAPRQELAYRELAKYLFSLTSQRFADLRPDLREDVAQSALERVFKSFDRCREPVAFMTFAAQHLLDAVRMVRRQENRPVESFERTFGASETAQFDLADDAQPQPIERAIAAERRQAIEQFLQEFLRDHPRAAQQVAVLRLDLADELDDLAIARRLGMSTNSVYAARSRIIKTIQSEPKWRSRAGELGILPDEL